MKKGIPALCIVTGEFEQLAKTIMRSRNVPESVAVLIEGQPEAVSDAELMTIADRVVDEVITRLTVPPKG